MKWHGNNVGQRVYIVDSYCTYRVTRVSETDYDIVAEVASGEGN